MKKEKINSEELGESLFDFAIMSCQSFLRSFDKGKVDFEMFYKSLNKEDINPSELLIAYLWFIFNFLNVMGANYQNTARYMHNAYVSFLNLKKPETDSRMEHLFSRYEEYKKGFYDNLWEGFDDTKISQKFKNDVKIGPNFKKVSNLIANNVLGKINTNVFFALSLAIHLKETLTALNDLLKECDLKE